MEKVEIGEAASTELDGHTEEGNHGDTVIVNRQEECDGDLMGKVVKSEKEAFDLYNDYALRMGFSVRRGKCRYHQGTNLISQREFYCWKEGFNKAKDDSQRGKKSGRLETRTGCKAFIRFTVKDGLWTVTHFHAEHNHELATRWERHLLKSGRMKRDAKAAMCMETEGEDVDGSDETIIVHRQEDYDDNLLGKVVHSEEEAFNLYNEYAIRTGFSVRRGKYRYHQGTNKISRREFLCWKEGLKIDDDPQQASRLNKLETRTGCKACIRFSVTDNVWTVTHFHAEHNHKLASPSERYLLRSKREITDGKVGLVDTNAGTSRKRVLAHLREEVGAEKFGSTKFDFCNYVNNKKTIQIEAGDAQSLLDHFKRRKVEDPMFSYAVQVDKENRITNFYWRDGRMRFDYDCFGDVVVFDTTYRTTKYNIICAFFVGVNHYWQNIILGGAFLLDETTSSYVWLFRSFYESMGNRAPKTIITDEDQTISNAVAAVFPNTCHCLCMSQIAKKTPQFLELLNTESEFRDLFYECYRCCGSEVEFESTWDQMVQKFNLGDQNWVKLLYKSRFKWSSVFAGDTFYAGISSSQRNERTNSVLVGVGDASMNLTNFIHAFDNVVSGMRSNELEEDFRCEQGAPSIAVVNSAMLTHASKVYTRRIYEYFEKQFLTCLATTWVENTSNGPISNFQIAEEGNTKVCLVQFDTSNNALGCSCKMFELDGILCSHALRVLNVECLSEIPRQYILKRWTKEAKKGMMTYEESASSDVNSREKESLWRNGMTRIAFNLIQKSHLEGSTRQLCRKKLLEIEDYIEREVARLKLSENSALSEVERCNKMQPSIDQTHPAQKDHNG